MAACYDDENNSEVLNLLIELERMNPSFELLKEHTGLIYTIYSATEYGEERPEKFCVDFEVQNFKVDQKVETTDDIDQVIILSLIHI